MEACFSGYDATRIFYRQKEAAVMSPDEREAMDDTLNDADEPVSKAALDSSTHYTRGMLVRRFPGEKHLKETIAMLSKRLADGETEEQFYAFRGVPKKFVDRTNENTSLLGSGTRITYFWNEEILIVKLPDKVHDIAHLEFGNDVREDVRQMGIPKRGFISMGGARMRGRECFKEGDSTFGPSPARHRKDDWPTLVIEAGNSQSRRSLRTIARCWLSNSNGDVKIVIIISIYNATKKMVIEKWCEAPGTRRLTRSGGGPGNYPTIVQTTTVSHIPNALVDQPTSYNVGGAPLVLEFDKIFLRAPIFPETNISLGVPELQDFASRVWGSVQ